MRRARVLELSTFCAVAAALLAFLFRDAWLHGHVLGQTDFLFDFLPWQPSRPPGWRTHNRLLGDIPVVFYPFLSHAREAVRNGEFPLWISAIGAGQPFFGAFQTAVLSPFTLLHYADHRVTIATRADEQRLLVLTDVYYPGWIATVDGERVPIHRANYAFRAVSVPAGEHIVEFRYRPASVRYGAIGSIVGCLAAALLCFCPRRSAF